MKKLLIFIAIGISSITICHGQTILEQVIEKVLKPKTEKTSKNKKERINKNPKVEVYEIPVVFHVVAKERINKYAIEIKIKELIANLNYGFNQVDKNKVEIEFQEDVGKSNIIFYPASFLYPKCNISNITFHQTDKPFFDFMESANAAEQLPYDGTLKKYGYMDSNKYLNIWICNLEQPTDGGMNMGYSTFPKEKMDKNDGVVLDFKVIYNSDLNIRRASVVHEVGHWLGLYHINGREAINRCIPKLGDFVSDTPPQQNLNNRKDVMNNIIEKVCYQSWRKGNYENFMDYSYVYGMFTKGQVQRMRKQIQKFRSGLLTKVNCTNESTSGGGNSNSNSSSSKADVCFENYIYYQRKVVLTNKKTNYSKSILMATGNNRNPKISCLYELPAGVYRCQVYTTFSKSLVEDFEVRLLKNKPNKIKLTQMGN